MSIPFKVLCPKCGRSLKPASELSSAGSTELVYQCDECLQSVEMFGETLEIALTFTVKQKNLAAEGSRPKS